MVSNLFVSSSVKSVKGANSVWSVCRSSVPEQLDVWLPLGSIPRADLFCRACFVVGFILDPQNGAISVAFVYVLACVRQLTIHVMCLTCFCAPK